MGAPMKVMKACGKCGRKLPRTADYFYLDARTGRYYAPCKACKNQATQRRRRKAKRHA